MDKRQTVESIKARQIFAEIKGLPHPFLKTYTLFEANPVLVAQNLRKLVDENTTVTLKNNTMYVGTTQHTRHQKMVKMVKALMLTTDNARLYEEAAALIRFRNNT